MKIMTMQCGCQIAYEDDNDNLEVWQSIMHSFCPMHKAAPLMFQALEALQRGFMDGSIKFTAKRQSDSEPYHPANVLMVAALNAVRDTDGNQ